MGLERKDLEEGEELPRQEKKVKQKGSWLVLETRWAVEFWLRAEG